MQILFIVVVRSTIQAVHFASLQASHWNKGNKYFKWQEADQLAIYRARKIFEFHLAHWANKPQILLAQALAQVFKLINNSWTQEWKSKYRRVLNLM